MKIYGLIGRKLGHSFSPDYFSKKFAAQGIAAEYRIFEMENTNNIKKLVREIPGLEGFNVTIPFKREIIEQLDELDKAADKMGSVNTVKVRRHGNSIHLCGYNTDVYGFEHSLLPLISRSTIKQALILGTGGSAQAVSYVLAKLQIIHLFVSRHPEQQNHLSYNDLNDVPLADFQLIVNTTPAGMFPDVDSLPKIPYNQLTEKHVLFDLVYNPSETAFLKKGIEHGAQTKSGLEMLHLQAEESWRIWQSNNLEC